VTSGEPMHTPGVS